MGVLRRAGPVEEEGAAYTAVSALSDRSGKRAIPGIRTHLPARARATPACNSCTMVAVGRGTPARRHPQRSRKLDFGNTASHEFAGTIGML